MKLSDFDYSLPKSLIAQYPLKKRDKSRLLVINRKKKTIGHKNFNNIIDYLNAGDLLILNNTKVVLARLFGFRKNTGGKVEILLQEQIINNRFKALINPLGKLKIGEEISINNNGLSFRLLDFANRIIEFNKKDILAKLDKIGHVPLPQYIKRQDLRIDKIRYQTVYAEHEGSIAAPTAGLHFTKSLLNKIRDKGVNVAFVTLHVGYGTFAPIRDEDISNHKMHKEYLEIPYDTIKLIRQTKDSDGKVVAVGTTSCRALESNKGKILNRNTISTIKGYVDLFIYPPFKFKIIDSLITNFHLPKSTLYLLVATFTGLNTIKKAYSQAIENKYRFYSYGDSMIIL
ncbi:MAG: tRNA preQ1(34) S-adenosylmethionine ribosyltransferase-isomerase QueA [Candidatus Omnitrophota bacterium]